MSLAIHLLGSGFGESIIVTLPNGNVGVIDCFTSKLKVASSDDYREHNPTLRYLRKQLNADRLAFVALTHPHEDHGRGISQILEDYKNCIDEIWIYDAYQDIGLERYFLALFSAGRKLPIERLLDEEPGTFSEELLKIRKLVLDQTNPSNPHRATHRSFSGTRTVSIVNETVQFHFLGPSEALAENYKASIIENLKNVVDLEGNVVNESWEHKKINHNLASPAILCEYGETRLLLSGDIESSGWDEAIRDEFGNRIVAPCHFMKISHHGSITGYTETLFDRFGKDLLPLAALTPFNRHEKPLPRHEGVSFLADQFDQIWTTSMQDTHRSMGILEPLDYDELLLLRPILLSWKSSIDASPNLWGALDPDVAKKIGGNESATPVRSIPTDWLTDLVRQPRLASLLHPDLRIAYVPKPSKVEPIEDEYRLSFVFDDAGNELDDLRHVGGAAGQLT